MLDIVISGGTIVDGTGSEGYLGDIGISDGQIVEIGAKISSPARETIDADGAVVTPAWIDVHTHYDGQCTWDEDMEPSAGQGVGTIVMGNCGVGFAPVLPRGERDLIDLMEGVEDIPGTALYEAVPWGSWESYPQYLDFLSTRRFAIDVSSMIAHSAVRNYVMGGLDRANDAPSLEQIDRMANIVEEALRAGAVGFFSTGRVTGHRTIHGASVPGTFAEEAELTAIAHAMKRAGRGVLQAIPAGSFNWAPEEPPLQRETELLCRLSAMSGRKTTYSLIQKMDDADEWRDIMRITDEANARGAQAFAQVGSRPAGFVFSLDTYHSFMARPSYLALKHLPLTERAAEMRKAEVKARILAETDVTPEFPGKMEALIPLLPLAMEHTFPLTAQSTYEPDRTESFGAAVELDGGQDGYGYLYDYLAAGDGRNFAISFFANYADFNLDHVREMQLADCAVIGLSDAGAHVGAILDAVSPTYQLTYWARDRRRGTLPLKHIVELATRRNAELFGFRDRGVLRPGMRADINVIDFAGLKLGEMEVWRDLPSGGARLMQPAEGYIANLIKGEVTRRNDRDTGARPGRLARSMA